ncbi:MAG TPA: urease accessory protein UreH [Terriglobia bacterium]|nr:urease accessory protein UreH [Terriglobia bacterium]
MNESIAVTLGLGFALGLKHATEADHLAAVSTIVSERRSLVRAAAVGALWGAGHTASLVVAGFMVIVMGVAIPEWMSNWLELGVAAMIVALAGRLLYVVLRHQRRAHLHTHTHDGATHAHFHFHDARGAHSVAVSHHGPHAGLTGWRPLLVGVIHGLAGSAALTLLVLTEVSRNGGTVLGLAYLAVFGAGSVGGMMIMSCLIGLPFRLMGMFERALFPMRLLAGLGSAVFGLAYAWNIVGKL